MIRTVILGIIQGFTEFLPVSSSGHLAVVENYFGIKEPVVLAAFMHFGTLLATVVFFAKPIFNIIRGAIAGKEDCTKYLVFIVLGNIPAVVFALPFRSTIEHSFMNIRLVALFLGMTGVVVLLTGLYGKGQRPVNFLKALVIGISQMFALFPGLSRSGLTISTGLYLKVDPQEAFRFSFLLSLPAVLGANLFELKEITRFDDPLALIIGMIVSFIVGLLALRILRDLVQKKFFYFGFYCLVISIVIVGIWK